MPTDRKHSRHIDIRRYYVRELVLASIIKLVPLGKDIIANVLKKLTPAPALVRHRETMIGRRLSLFAHVTLKTMETMKKRKTNVVD